MSFDVRFLYKIRKYYITIKKRTIVELQQTIVLFFETISILKNHKVENFMILVQIYKTELYQHFGRFATNLMNIFK